MPAPDRSLPQRPLPEPRYLHRIQPRCLGLHLPVSRRGQRSRLRARHQRMRLVAVPTRRHVHQRDRAVSLRVSVHLERRSLRREGSGFRRWDRAYSGVHDPTTDAAGRDDLAESGHHGVDREMFGQVRGQARQRKV